MKVYSATINSQQTVRITKISTRQTAKWT